MAHTNLAVSTVGYGGVALSLASADTSNGNKFSNDGHTFLLISNASVADSAVVTIEVPGTYAGQALADVAITVAADSSKVAGPFPQEIFNIKSGTDVNCVRFTTTGDGAADVDVMAFN